MYYINESNDSSELCYQLLKRYYNLGCTLNEAIMLANQTLTGEQVIISTDGNIQDPSELYGLDLNPDLLFDYLFYNE